MGVDAILFMKGVGTVPEGCSLLLQNPGNRLLGLQVPSLACIALSLCELVEMVGKTADKFSSGMASTGFFPLDSGRVEDDHGI